MVTVTRISSLQCIKISLKIDLNNLILILQYWNGTH